MAHMGRMTSLGKAWSEIGSARANIFSYTLAGRGAPIIDAMRQSGEKMASTLARGRAGSERLSIVRPSWYHSVVGRIFLYFKLKASLAGLSKPVDKVP